MISRSLKRCRHGVVRTKGPIVWVSNSTSLRVMFMAAPHRADWCQNSLTRHPFGKVRNTSLCADYLFQSTKMHRVQLLIAEGNIASERVAEKCGFTYEGTARQAMFTRGRHRDMRIYSLFRHEVETCLPSCIFSSGTTPDR